MVLKLSTGYCSSRSYTSTEFIQICGVHYFCVDLTGNEPGDTSCLYPEIFGGLCTCIYPENFIVGFQTEAYTGFVVGGFQVVSMRLSEAEITRPRP